MATPNPYPMPGPTGAIPPPNYADTYPALGLSGLAQGFTHGLELGHEWGHQADELQAKKDQMANEASWRETQSKQAADYHAGELKNRADMLEFMKSQAGKIGTPITDENGNVVGYQTGKGGIVKPTASPADKISQKKDEAINGAVAAYMAMDTARGLGKGFMPEDSGIWAMAKSPFEKLRQVAQKTSPESNFRNKEGEAATLFATAVNKAGGGRMTETEVENMAKAAGSSGIGDTQSNILEKHEALKNELAAKIGVTRKEIDDAVAARAGGGGPKIGDIEDGHKFKGGDPSDSANWVKM